MIAPLWAIGYGTISSDLSNVFCDPNFMRRDACPPLSLQAAGIGIQRRLLDTVATP